MQNLKIRVNNGAESKEAQELFFEIGYQKSKQCKWLIDACIQFLATEGGFLHCWDCEKFGQTRFETLNHKEITLPELRAMVHQDQDEPFLTPECTLNDQYAEIEQVRQSKKHERNSSAWDVQVGGDHYKQFQIQPMQFALENKLDAAQQNVIKYIMRHSFKNGKQDLEKAKHYIDLMIEFYYGENNNG